MITFLDNHGSLGIFCQLLLLVLLPPPLLFLYLGVVDAEEGEVSSGKYSDSSIHLLGIIQLRILARARRESRILAIHLFGIILLRTLARERNGS